MPCTSMTSCDPRSAPRRAMSPASWTCAWAARWWNFSRPDRELSRGPGLGLIELRALESADVGFHEMTANPRCDLSQRGVGTQCDARDLAMVSLDEAQVGGERAEGVPS